MYHTFSDLTAVVPEQDLRQLVDDERSGDPIVQSPPNALAQRVESAGEKAATVIDGYCRGRYTVPLSPVPGVIVEISVALTLVNLYCRKQDLVESDGVKTRRKTAMDLLEHINAGKIVLYDSTPTPAEYSTNKTADDRVFSKENLQAF